MREWTIALGVTVTGARKDTLAGAEMSRGLWGEQDSGPAPKPL